MAAVFVVGLFFLSVPEAILIGTTVVLVVACIIGLFAFWHISFNLSSITLLCLAVGFSVDYSAHISKAFSEQSTSLSKADRVGTALVNQGSAVVHAGASTFVAVIVLSGASMEGYVVLFKSMLGMVSATSSVRVCVCAVCASEERENSHLKTDSDGDLSQTFNISTFFDVSLHLQQVIFGVSYGMCFLPCCLMLMPSCLGK